MSLSLPLTYKKLTVFKATVFLFLGLFMNTTLTAQWAFLKGTGAGYWGTRGTSSSVTQPSARSSFATCSDNSGNIWVFGGYGADVNRTYGRLNDLWKYSTSTNEWTWVSGNNDGTVDIVSTYGTKGVSDNANVPSVRTGPNMWADLAGNIWVWGGGGFDSDGNSGNLSDLWKYDTKSDKWTWMNGSDLVNTPAVYGIRGEPHQENQPAYMNAASAVDRYGNLWLTGANSGFEIWRYNTLANKWTFLGKNNYYGVYGIKGTPASENLPGYRYYHSATTDTSGNLWIFGGYGYNISNYTRLNDLWEYNPSTDKWKWVSGSSNSEQIGIYGNQGTYDAKNHPGARYYSSISFDSNNDLFLFGGYGISGLGTEGGLNDLWNFDPALNGWTWLSGSKGPNQGTVYGTKGIPSINNHPGGNYYGSFSFSWKGKVFIYGGANTNEVWGYKYNISPTVSISNPANHAKYNAPASIEIVATASDPDGSVDYVQFFNGALLLKTDSSSPYTYTWDSVGIGNYAITAKATDNNGATTTSGVVNISVIKNIPPAITITAPDSNAHFSAPADIFISAAASDSDGTISYVQFFSDSTLLYTDSTSPYNYAWNNIGAGNYIISAKAVDNGGLTTSSAAVPISVISNKPPLVSLTSPDSNDVYIAPAAINISAAASDSDGTISYVQFFNGSTILKTDSISPYSYSWTNVAEGNYTIIATAVDNAGASATSSVNIAVVPNKAPVVEITTPGNNAVYVSPADIEISATASDSDGTIKFVQFFNGAALLATDSVAPYSFLWSDVSVGYHTIMARVTDNFGLFTTSDSVNISVVENKAPSVNFITPDNNSIYLAPANITLNVAASDSDGTLNYVQFYMDGKLKYTDSTSPYSMDLDSLPVGNYSFVAKAFDNKGLSSSTASVTVSVASSPGKAPIVNITGPAANAVYIAPASITINATALDPDGVINNVKFYNGSVLIATDFTAPYSYTINNLVAGSYKFYVQATDNSGLKNSSSTVVALVVAPAANKVPNVKITSPANNAQYPALSDITLNAEATDADGPITGVQFYDGSVLLKTDNLKPYNFTVTQAATGNHSFVARAIDNNGAVSNSATVNVAVGLSSATNKAPIITITAPDNNTTLIAGSSIIINATATDPDGTVTNVKFYNGSTLLKTDSVSPYNYTIPGAATGSYKLYAKATDNKGMSSSSETVSVVLVPVPANKAPVITLASPANNAVYFAPATILLSALASDPDDSVVNVKFYQGSTLIATDSAFPYGYTLTNLTKGSYSFVARATDKNGVVSNSATAVVVVSTAPNLAPLVDLSSPVNNQTFAAPATITLNATASDTDGTVSNVKFYSDTTLLSSDNTAPYSFTLNNVPAGRYRYYAMATDNKGMTNSTATVYVVITGDAANAYPVAVTNTEAVSNERSVNRKNNVSGAITVKLAPNPVHDILHILSSRLEPNKKETISILSASGVTMKTVNTSSSGKTTKINVSSLANGMYIIKVMSNNQVTYQQFIKF